METVIRVAVIYAFILFGLRILGKRDFGKLGPLELVSLLLIPEIVQQGLVREDYSLTNALIGVATLLCLVFLTSTVTHRCKRVETLLQGEPTLLAADGRMLTDNMNRERVTPGELFAEMRKAGIERLDQVRWAVLESDGKISIVPRSQETRLVRDAAESGAGAA